MEFGERERNTVVISVGNQKGGVGKTTNTIQLASALAERGRLSLIVDLDMTSGATKALRAPTASPRLMRSSAPSTHRALSSTGRRSQS